MASLTYAAHVSRKIIKFGGVGIIGVLVLWSLGTAAVNAYIAAHPPYYSPTVKYGIIPKIVYPEKKFETKTFLFEFAGDAVPKFSDQSRVYVIYQPLRLYLALDEAKKTAKELNFGGEPTEKSYGVYEFKNDTFNLTLTMNVIDGSFIVRYPYLNDQLLLNPEKVPDKIEATTIAKEYLSSANKLTPDLENGQQKITFWKIEYDGLKSVPSQSEANVVRVDFFRKDLAETKFVTANLNEAPVSILVSGSTVENKKVVEVNYKYMPIDEQSFSTYPIKTNQEAMAELKSGNYWPVNDVGNNNMTIRKLYLAYFEPVSLTNYLQPIYVFEGDGGFVAYVQAVADKWVK